MRESIVDPGVHSRYVNEGIHFLVWCIKKYPDWLTDDFRGEYTEQLKEVEGEKITKRRARIKEFALDRVKHSRDRNILAINKFTPEGVMEFLAAQCDQSTGLALSNSGYSGKRSAIKHLVRCQEGRHWNEDFENQLDIPWRGFTRLTTNDQARETRRGGRRRRQNTQQEQQQEQQS